MTGTQTLEQKRASFALGRINARKSLTAGDQKKYVSYVSALPATIVMNGLGQALAAELAAAKGDAKNPHRLVYEDVAGWLTKTEALPELHGKTDLLEALVQGDQHVYVRAQGEALRYCTWLKQFARAFLENPDGTVER